jgi:hypothetical protein
VGWPDLTFTLKGRSIAVELKSAKGKLTQEQKDTLAQLKRNGAEVYVMRSFDTFYDLLNGHRPKQWEGE